jgi:hypothetical protein
LGSELTVGVVSAEMYPPVRLEVVGTYAPSDDQWWQAQPLLGISAILRARMQPRRTMPG